MKTIPRKSPLHDMLKEKDPILWKEVHGMPVVLRFAELKVESLVKRHLALADVSCFPRLGLRGIGSSSWLTTLGFNVPKTIYSVAPIENQGTLVKIDKNEVIIEDGLHGTVVSRISQEILAAPKGIFSVVRQEASFFLIGNKSCKVISETCGHDLKESEDQVVMTRVAGVSCCLLPIQSSEFQGYRIWVDPSYSVYLWKILLEIVHEYEGDMIGLASLYPSLS